jgi:DnaA family protein
MGERGGAPEQLTFELVPPESPTFDNFLAGANGEVVAALRRAALGTLTESSIVLWGGAGVGKTHLLRAAEHAATAASRSARFVRAPALAPAEPPELGALVAVDDVERADADAQARLFTLYNTLAGTGGQLIVAAAAPPARLPLRDDLRTRLGHGLVYEVVGLSDDDKPAALAQFAAARGFRLEPAVVDYLLAHYRRDMPSLLAMLVSIDRYSLATRRAVSLPLVRDLVAASARPVSR